MRISEFARKFSVTPSEIIKYLEKEGEKIESYNARLNKDQIELLNSRFGDKKNEEAKSELPETEKGLIENIQIPQKAKDESDSAIEFSLEPEKIDIPKPRLQGIKVVGKIDLPDKPAKDDQEKIKEVEQVDKRSTPGENPVKRKKSGKTKRKTNKGKHQKIKNTGELSYKEKIELEKERTERKKRIAKRKEKEKKRRRYEIQVQSRIPTTPQKTNKKSVKIEDEDKVIREKPQYKNPLRRLWAWLNGEYDDRY